MVRTEDKFTNALSIFRLLVGLIHTHNESYLILAPEKYDEIRKLKQEERGIQNCIDLMKSEIRDAHAFENKRTRSLAYATIQVHLTV